MAKWKSLTKTASLNNSAMLLGGFVTIGGQKNPQPPPPSPSTQRTLHSFNNWTIIRLDLSETCEGHDFSPANIEWVHFSNPSQYWRQTKIEAGGFTIKKWPWPVREIFTFTKNPIILETDCRSEERTLWYGAPLNSPFDHCAEAVLHTHRRKGKKNRRKISWNITKMEGIGENCSNGNLLRATDRHFGAARDD